MDVVRSFNDKVCRWVLGFLNEARDKLALRLHDTNPLRIFDHLNANNCVGTLENFFVAAFKDLIAEQNQNGFSVVALLRQRDCVSESLWFILPEIRCREIVVPFDIFADLPPVVANDENQFGEVGQFKEWFEEMVKDGTPCDMYQCLRGSESVGSESVAAAGGRDNDFHSESFLG